MYAETENSEKIWAPDENRTHNLPYTSRVMIHKCHSVIVWYNPCIITQYCDLALHMSSRGSVVERPTRVWKVMGSIPIWSSDFFRVLYLRIYLYTLFLSSFSRQNVVHWLSLVSTSYFDRSGFGTSWPFVQGLFTSSR